MSVSGLVTVSIVVKVVDVKVADLCYVEIGRRHVVPAFGCSCGFHVVHVVIVFLVHVICA
eukprot:4273366-Amphidinium_carterae.1